MINWLLVLFKPFWLFVSDGNWRAYHWLLIRFGDIKDHERQIVYARSFRLEVVQMQDFLNRFKLYFVNRLLLFKRQNGQNPLIFDLSAGEGLSTAFFCEAYPDSKVYSWEPNPLQRELLILNMDSTRYKPVEVLPGSNIQEVVKHVSSLQIEQIDLLKIGADEFFQTPDELIHITRNLYVSCMETDQLMQVLQKLRLMNYQCKVVNPGPLVRLWVKPVATPSTYLVLANPAA